MGARTFAGSRVLRPMFLARSGMAAGRAPRRRGSVERLAEHTVTLAELLTEHTPDWMPPRLSGRAVAQVHCHQHAVLGWDADQKLLERCGIDPRRLRAPLAGVPPTAA